MPKNPISMLKLSKLRMLTVKFINIKKIEYDTFSYFSTKLSNIKDNWEMIHRLKIAKKILRYISSILKNIDDLKISIGSLETFN